MKLLQSVLTTDMYRQLVTDSDDEVWDCTYACNSLYFNLLKSQTNCLQLIQNYLVCVVVIAPKSCHISPLLKSLHWLKINERIDYKLLSLTHKVLTTTQPSYLHYLISLQPPRCTRTSSVVILARPQASSSLKITNRSFRYPSPHLWNKRPIPLHQFYTALVLF